MARAAEVPMVASGNPVQINLQTSAFLVNPDKLTKVDIQKRILGITEKQTTNVMKQAIVILMRTQIHMITRSIGAKVFPI